MNISLLPSNTTDFQRTLEAAVDVVDIIGPAVADLRGFKSHRPLNPTIAPWLVQEYGLGPISVYFDVVEDLIDEGRPWQRIRGTPQAVSTALAWIGYDAVTVLDQVTGRRRWHLYQADMGGLPIPDEAELLANAEYLADLSDRSRSFFWRGFHGYDVRGLTYGRSKWGRSIWGDSSGVRIGAGKVKWSHGRQHDLTIEAMLNDQISLGTIFNNGDRISWLSTVTWDTPGVTWDQVTDARALNAWLLLRKGAMVAYYDDDGAVLAYSPVMMAPVDMSEEGTEDSLIRYAVRTDFGNGLGLAAKSISLVFGASRAAGVKPGLRWLMPDQVVATGATKVGKIMLELTFLETVREFVTVDFSLPAVLVGSPGDDFLTDNDGVRLTTSEAEGSDDLIVPQEGLIPSGTTVLTDLSGEQLTTGPFEAVDLIYGPEGE